MPPTNAASLVSGRYLRRRYCISLSYLFRSIIQHKYPERATMVFYENADDIFCGNHHFRRAKIQNKLSCLLMRLSRGCSRLALSPVRALRLTSA
eukprot:scaffold2365_cov77-Skeletonema_dohrnii-CCMP3373.AAC.15